MSEIVFSPNKAQHAIYQIIDMMATLVSERVSDKINDKLVSTINKALVDVMPTNDFDELLTIKELEVILKVKKGALNEWRIKGILVPDLYVGRSPRYKRSSIDLFINSKN